MCGQSDTLGFTDDILVVTPRKDPGGLFPLADGWFSKLGDQCFKAAILAVEDVNNKLDLLQGVQLVMDYHDTEGSTKTVTDVMNLILARQKPVIAVVGSMLSSPTITAAEISSTSKITQISYGATSPDLSNKKRFPYFFRTTSSGMTFQPVYLEIMEKFDWKRVATITTDVEPFASITESLVAELNARSKTVVSSEVFSDDVELENALKHLKEKNVRIIFGNFYESTAKKVICQAYKLKLTGIDIQWVLPGYYTPGWWNNTNIHVDCTTAEMISAIDGYMTIGSAMMNQDDDAFTVSGMTPREFRSRMNKTHGITWPHGHQIPMANSYDAVWSVALAIEATVSAIVPDTIDNFQYNSTMSDVFFAKMSQLDFVGVSGRMKFDSNGDSSGPVIVEQYRSEPHGDRERTIGVYNSENAATTWTETDAQIWSHRGGVPPADSSVSSIATDVFARILTIAVTFTICTKADWMF